MCEEITGNCIVSIPGSLSGTACVCNSVYMSIHIIIIIVIFGNSSHSTHNVIVWKLTGGNPSEPHVNDIESNLLHSECMAYLGREVCTYVRLIQILCAMVSNYTCLCKYNYACC